VRRAREAGRRLILARQPQRQAWCAAKPATPWISPARHRLEPAMAVGGDLQVVAMAQRRLLPARCGNVFSIRLRVGRAARNPAPGPGGADQDAPRDHLVLGRVLAQRQQPCQPSTAVKHRPPPPEVGRRVRRPRAVGLQAQERLRDVPGRTRWSCSSSSAAARHRCTPFCPYRLRLQSAASCGRWHESAEHPPRCVPHQE
jgi:hypothetical protein